MVILNFGFTLTGENIYFTEEKGFHTYYEELTLKDVLGIIENVISNKEDVELYSDDLNDAIEFTLK